MTLDVADWADLVKVLRESYDDWHSGLSRQSYVQLNWRQLHSRWARKNYKFLVARQNGEIVSSCKLFNLDFQSRSKLYRIGGIGAVYTPPRFRGNGFASQMLEMVEERCSKDSFDGLLLYSDIDPDIYERLGYESLSDCEFHIWVDDPKVESWILSEQILVGDLAERSAHAAGIEIGDVETMIRHYRRYLAAKAYGVYRTDSYLLHKLAKEKFLCEHSLRQWPRLEIISLDPDKAEGGYAVFEQGGPILRVHEVVGSAKAVEILWRNLLRTALLRKIQLIRGWEAVAPTFVKGVTYVERDWGHPMLLPLNKQVEGWLERIPCQLLELDYF